MPDALPSLQVCQIGLRKRAGLAKATLAAVSVTSDGYLFPSATHGRVLGHIEQCL